jgi:hypothetical protein
VIRRKDANFPWKHFEKSRLLESIKFDFESWVAEVFAEESFEVSVKYQRKCVRLKQGGCPGSSVDVEDKTHDQGLAQTLSYA